MVRISCKLSLRVCKLWRRQPRDVDFTWTECEVPMVPTDGVRKVRREPPVKGRIRG